MLRISPNSFAFMLRALVMLLAGVLLAPPASADFAQQGAKLVGRGVSGQSAQGWSSALSADGNTAIVGGMYDNNSQGAFWIFVRSSGEWTQQGSKMQGANGVGTAQQGRSVAVSADGNTALIGGYTDDNSTGAAWVFVRSGGAWSQEGGKLVGTGSVGAARQGVSVALSADGNTALIGGYADNASTGAAWVFTRNAGVWTQQGNKLVATDSVGNAEQGHSVALSADGNIALVGGFGDHSKGAAWVFARNSGAWSQVGNKLAANGSAYLGYSVALSADGKTAAVGGPLDGGAAGAAWVFVFDGTTWSQQGSKLVGAAATGAANQGYSVALSGDGDALLSGGYSDANGVGAAWMFIRAAGAWSQLGNKLVGSGGTGLAYQGLSAALSSDGSTAIVGGTGDDSGIGASWVWLRRTPHDFGGEGKSDILWRNTSGETGVWFMNGASIASLAGLGSIPTSWSIAGQRDFDGDGKNDLLWRSSSGEVGIWFLNGATVASLVALGTVDTSWSVVGTGDFDGDGKGDILWRNTSGETGIWFMSGGSVSSLAGLGNVDAAWSVAGTGDFDGDGKTDILWRSTSGETGIWFMDGGTIASLAGLGTIDATWSIVGTGDFDGGGKTDILWRNASGAVGIWIMDGATVSPVGLGSVAAAWSVASVGDYNGDGKADILWRKTSHDIGVWFMNGATLVSTALLGNVGASWLVQNAASN